VTFEQRNYKWENLIPRNHEFGFLRSHEGLATHDLVQFIKRGKQKNVTKLNYKISLRVSLSQIANVGPS
jgi:hypothetical protein